MKYQICQFQKDQHIVDGNFTNLGVQGKFYDSIMEGKVSPSTFLAHYEIVGEIEANDLDEVFHIGNVGPESSIKRIKKMHSVSVGDVIRDEDGKCFIVQPAGFSRLGEVA